VQGADDLGSSKLRDLQSASELYRPSDRRFPAKSVPYSADRGRHVVSATDPYGRKLDFLDPSRYFFFQVASQLYSRGWVEHVPDPLLLRKSGSGKSNPDLWICIQELWLLDHRGGRNLGSLLTNTYEYKRGLQCCFSLYEHTQGRLCPSVSIYVSSPWLQNGFQWYLLFS
jgi:hypothetical protein